MFTKNFQRYQLDLEKIEEPEIRLPTSVGSKRKQRNSKKVSTSASLTTPKPVCGQDITGRREAHSERALNVEEFQLQTGLRSHVSGSVLWRPRSLG